MTDLKQRVFIILNSVINEWDTDKLTIRSRGESIQVVHQALSGDRFYHILSARERSLLQEIRTILHLTEMPIVDMLNTLDRLCLHWWNR